MRICRQVLIKTASIATIDLQYACSSCRFLKQPTVIFQDGSILATAEVRAEVQHSYSCAPGCFNTALPHIEQLQELLYDTIIQPHPLLHSSQMVVLETTLGCYWQHLVSKPIWEPLLQLHSVANVALHQQNFAQVCCTVSCWAVLGSMYIGCPACADKRP